MATFTLRRMEDKVNLNQKFTLLDQPYSPGIVGYLNDYKLQVVKVHGEFVWHRHDDTDDGRHLCQRSADDAPLVHRAIAQHGYRDCLPGSGAR